MAHGAPHDAAEHVAPSLVRGVDTVGHQERRSPQMVGHDAVARGLWSVGIDAGQARHRHDDGPHEVDRIVRRHALQDGRDAFEAHAGIDRGAGQRHALAGTDLIELHEDEVPEFQEAVAVLVGASGRPAEDGLALVVEDLGAGATRAGVTGRPEIVRGRDADDAALRQSGHLLPKVESLVVVMIDRDEQARLVEPELPRHERPGVLDRGRLEIIAEREIAEHLEEGVMPGRIADIVEIVMLAAGSKTFLRRSGAAVGALLDTGEQVLELHHAGTGEHQRRIVAGDERPRRDDLVSRLAEEVEKSRAGLVDAGHGRGTRSSG